MNKLYSSERLISPTNTIAAIAAAGITVGLTCALVFQPERETTCIDPAFEAINVSPDTTIQPSINAAHAQQAIYKPDSTSHITVSHDKQALVLTCD